MDFLSGNIIGNQAGRGGRDLVRPPLSWVRKLKPQGFKTQLGKRCFKEHPGTQKLISLFSSLVSIKTGVFVFIYFMSVISFELVLTLKSIVFSPLGITNLLVFSLLYFSFFLETSQWKHHMRFDPPFIFPSMLQMEVFRLKSKLKTFSPCSQLCARAGRGGGREAAAPQKQDQRVGGCRGDGRKHQRWERRKTKATMWEKKRKMCGSDQPKQCGISRSGF